MGGIQGPVWSSLLIIGVVAAIAGSGVVAVFTDVEHSVQNVLEGGSLDLKLDGGDGATTFSVSNAAPGATGRGSTTLSNLGSLTGELSARIDEDDIRNAPGVTYEEEPRPDEGEMGQVAEMFLFIDANRNGLFDGNDTGLSAVRLDGSTDCVRYAPPQPLYSKIDDYAGCTWPDLAEMGPDVDFVSQWRVPSDAGNETMGDQVFVRFDFVLDGV